MNFDGDVEDDGERVPVPLMQVSPGNYTFEKTVGLVQDDGRWTDSAGNLAWSNETALDSLPIAVKVKDDDTGFGESATSPDIYNIAPQFGPSPDLVIEYDQSENPILATISATFNDPALNDFHQVDVTWGDGISGDGINNPITLPLGSRNFTISRDLSVTPETLIEDLFPILVLLSDDDLGQQLLVFNLSCDGITHQIVTPPFDSEITQYFRSTDSVEDEVHTGAALFVIPPTENVQEQLITGPPDPTRKEGASPGHAYKFTFKNGDLPVMAQQVEDTGSFTVWLSDGTVHSVQWIEKYVELWVWQGATVIDYSFFDQHRAGPQAASEYLESVLGKKFVATIDGKLCLRDKQAKCDEVEAWAIDVYATFTMVNGEYPGWNAGILQLQITPFRGPHTFEVSVDSTSIKPAPPGFDHLLYPATLREANNLGPNIATPDAAFPPPNTLGMQLVSRDEWHIRWESPNKSRTGTYSGGYQ